MTYRETRRLKRPAKIAIRAITTDDWQDFRTLRLAALREAPDAFGSTYDEWRDAPEQRWRERLRRAEINLVAEFEGRSAGLVSALASDGVGRAELISMWVAPFARGKGVGDILVRSVLDWARRQGLTELVLDVRGTNIHAIALYARNGFVKARESAGDALEKRMIFRL